MKETHGLQTDLRGSFFSQKELILFAIVLLFAATGPVRALSIRSNVHVIAWSKDGSGALLGVSAQGPEGGGSVNFRVFSAKENVDLAFELSDDMSPGDGSTPQRVWAIQCLSRLGDIKAAAARLHIEGVEYFRSGCFDSRRTVYGLVRAEVKQRKFVRELSGYPQLPVKDDLVLKHAEKSLVLYCKGQELHRRELPYLPPNSLLQAHVSPNGRLLLIGIISDYGARIIDILYSASGDAYALAPWTKK